MNLRGGNPERSLNTWKDAQHLVIREGEFKFSLIIFNKKWKNVLVTQDIDKSGFGQMGAHVHC